MKENIWHKLHTSDKILAGLILGTLICFILPWVTVPILGNINGFASWRTAIIFALIVASSALFLWKQDLSRKSLFILFSTIGLFGVVKYIESILFPIDLGMFGSVSLTGFIGAGLYLLVLLSIVIAVMLGKYILALEKKQMYICFVIIIVLFASLYAYTRIPSLSEDSESSSAPSLASDSLKISTAKPTELEASCIDVVDKATLKPSGFKVRVSMKDESQDFVKTKKGTVSLKLIDAIPKTSISYSTDYLRGNTLYEKSLKISDGKWIEDNDMFDAFAGYEFEVSSELINQKDIYLLKEQVDSETGYKYVESPLYLEVDYADGDSKLKAIVSPDSYYYTCDVKIPIDKVQVPYYISFDEYKCPDGTKQSSIILCSDLKNEGTGMIDLIDSSVNVKLNGEVTFNFIPKEDLNPNYAEIDAIILDPKGNMYYQTSQSLGSIFSDETLKAGKSYGVQFTVKKDYGLSEPFEESGIYTGMIILSANKVIADKSPLYLNVSTEYKYASQLSLTPVTLSLYCGSEENIDSDAAMDGIPLHIKLESSDGTSVPKSTSVKVEVYSKVQTDSYGWSFAKGKLLYSQVYDFSGESRFKQYSDYLGYKYFIDWSKIEGMTSGMPDTGIVNVKATVDGKIFEAEEDYGCNLR